MRSLLTLVLVGISFMSQLCVSAANAAQGQNQLHLVRTIYVGNMGDTDEAERFRLLLEEELAAKSFTVVDRPEKADAILSGALSVRVHDNKTRARVYVKLESQDGTRLWGKDFGSRMTSPFNRTEPVKLRAREVAKALRDALEKPN